MEAGDPHADAAGAKYSENLCCSEWFAPEKIVHLPVL